MTKRIKGKIVYKNLEGGFWGIITENGEELRPTELPVQLQEIDKEIECVIKFTESEFGIFMWGKSIEILIFVV